MIKRNETSCPSSKHLLFLKVSCSALPEITDCIKSGEMETEGRGDDDDDMNDDAAFPSGQNDYINGATLLLVVLASQTRLFILQHSIQTALGCKQSQCTKIQALWWCQQKTNICLMGVGRRGQRFVQWTFSSHQIFWLNSK